MFNIGAYHVLPISVTSVFNPDASSWAVSATKRRRVSDSEKKRESIVSTVTYIYMRHIATGFVFRFVGSKRLGVFGWSDGRHDVSDQGAKKHRMTPDEFTMELGRLLGSSQNAIQVIALAFNRKMKNAEAVNEVEPWNEAIDTAAIAHQAEVTRKKRLVNPNDYVPGKRLHI